MEQSQAFQDVLSTIKTIETRLLSCPSILQLCDITVKEAEKEIEAHFAKCINVLAARKAELLKEVTQRINEHKKNVQDAKLHLESSAKACTQILETGKQMYSSNTKAAEEVLKGLKYISVPNVSEPGFSTDLPDSIFELILTHGKVEVHERKAATGPSSIPAGSITILAGSNSEKGLVNGSGANARFNAPWGICFNAKNNRLYVADYNSSAIRRVTLEGRVTTAYKSDSLKSPAGIVMHKASKTFFVTNYSSHTIFKIVAASKVVSKFAGSGEVGKEDGKARKASFKYPMAITIDQQTGDLFVCDSGNFAIRKITQDGIVSTVAGSRRGTEDGNGAYAKFNDLEGIHFDNTTRSLLVCDSNSIRRVTLDGAVNTIYKEIPKPLAITVTATDEILVVSRNQVHRLVQKGHHYEAVVVAGTGASGTESSALFTARSIALHEPSHSIFMTDGNLLIYKLSLSSPLPTAPAVPTAPIKQEK